MMGGGRGGLVTAVMNHLSPPLPHTVISSGTQSKRTECLEVTKGLCNFAPLAVVTSSNPTAQPADALIQPAQYFPRTKVRIALFSLFF